MGLVQGHAEEDRWFEGPAEVRQGRSPQLECATLGVPLDYKDPGGRTIDIAVSRIKSENPSKRQGALLVNPGGPGVGGLGYPYVLAVSGLPQEVQDSYDLIGFDPRGVGRSTPVTCDLTSEQMEHRPVYARTPADVTKEAGYARDVARQCAHSATSWMLPHVSTANTARDMDRIRIALGESKISYLGTSYGTSLGAVYATLFSKRSDRFVLDSNLGPRGYDVRAMRLFGRGMEDRFPDFAKYAAAHPEYGLGATPGAWSGNFTNLRSDWTRSRPRDMTGHASAWTRSACCTSTPTCPLSRRPGRPWTRVNRYRRARQCRALRTPRPRVTT